MMHKNLLTNELYFQPPNFLDEDDVIVVMTFNACFFHSPLHWIRLETALGDFEAVSYDKTNLKIILCRLGFINYIFCNLICSFCKRKHNKKVSVICNKKIIMILEITEWFTNFCLIFTKFHTNSIIVEILLNFDTSI